VKRLVVALGGNALSPPAGDQSYSAERASVVGAARSLAALAARGYRLLIVHGNGPQVGRLMSHEPDPTDLDVHVAQTQGELGYLLAEAMARECADPLAALVTRVLVDADDDAFHRPSKPIGPLLADRPEIGASARIDGGWRRVVASPRPRAIVEYAAIAALLETHHVIAGGGGGVPIARVNETSRPMAGVIDKDWVAARLAIDLDAASLVFATNVAGAERAHGTNNAQLLPRVDVAAARALLAQGEFALGSMAPKVESAVDFVSASHRSAAIVHTDVLASALDDPPPGTQVVP